MENKKKTIRLVPALTHNNALERIAELVTKKEALDKYDVMKMAKVVAGIENTEVNAVADYVYQITRFVGNDHNIYQLVYEATAFSLVANALLNRCREHGEKYDEKCRDMWDICSERLIVRIQQGEKPDEYKY